MGDIEYTCELWSKKWCVMANWTIGEGKGCFRLIAVAQSEADGEKIAAALNFSKDSLPTEQLTLRRTMAAIDGGWI